MPQAVLNPEADPRRKVDAAVIAKPPTRHFRAAAFQIYALVAAVVFVVLAVAARTVPYFQLDLSVTHAVQAHHGLLFDRLMVLVSWFGFAPQAEIRNTAGPLNPQCVTNNGPSADNFVPGMRREAICTDTPANSRKRVSFVLKVNSEGTGDTIWCPSSLSHSQAVELLPVASMILSNSSEPIRQRWLRGGNPSRCGTSSIFSTLVLVKTLRL